MLVDELSISFYNILTRPELVGDHVIHRTFIVSHLKADTILGM